jgi:hypothetical protein
MRSFSGNRWRVIAFASPIFSSADRLSGTQPDDDETEKPF